MVKHPPTTHYYSDRSFSHKIATEVYVQINARAEKVLRLFTNWHLVPALRIKFPDPILHIQIDFNTQSFEIDAFVKLFWRHDHTTHGNPMYLMGKVTPFM